MRGEALVGRRAADRRDRPRARGPRAHPRHGRADCRADRAGGEAHLSHHPTAEGAIGRGDLHLALPERGLRDLRSYRRASRRTERRPVRDCFSARAVWFSAAMLGRVAGDLYDVTGQRRHAAQEVLSVGGLRCRASSIGHRLLRSRRGDRRRVRADRLRDRGARARASTARSDRQRRAQFTSPERPYRPTIAGPGKAAGIGFVAADRKREGIIGELSVRENMVAPFLERYMHGFFVSRSEETAQAKRWIDLLGIRTRGPEQKMRTLSGRQPAEGLRLALAGRQREAPDPRRADARRRHRCAPGDLSRASCARRSRARRARALLRRGGNRRDQRPLRSCLTAAGSSADSSKGAEPRRPDGGDGRRSRLQSRLKDESDMTIDRPSSAPTDQPPLTARQRLAALLGQPWSGVAILLVFYIGLSDRFSTLLTPFFLTLRNMMAIGSNIAFMGLMAAAGTPLIIAGGLDLSVAAIAGLVGVLLAVLHGDVGSTSGSRRSPRCLLGGIHRLDQRPFRHAAEAQSADRHARHDEHRLRRRADPDRRPDEAADGAGLQLDRLRPRLRHSGAARS